MYYRKLTQCFTRLFDVIGLNLIVKPLDVYRSIRQKELFVFR